MDREEIRERIAAAAGMPKDVVTGAAVLHILGNSELCIGNYRGIAEYTDCLIRIRTKYGQIRIRGNKLNVEYYTDSEMKITGKIHAVEFEDGRLRD